MVIVIPFIAIILLVFGPQVWVRFTMKRFGGDRPDLQGTGGELAQHLIERFELEGVTVQKGGPGEDYYNPEDKLVSLSPENYDGRSVTAVAVSTHEVGHALQHKEQHPGFMLRQRRIKTAITIERFSAIALMISPVIFLITRVPQSTLLTVAIGASGMLAAVWVQLVNLPVEMDASFKKALPILEEGYLTEQDMHGARKVLKAAAWTYVAGAMASLLNLGRWIAILRR
ncbi:zinc metallopeptidase [Sansalvadorimonas sp. 2012CJ34-2]|uniref:Zinc metallopeptidase n=1 Tax=Parendozoicomonas callyspongiae TaxID=2942213 RepID=A0ABT0PAC2_9GAMM|nr:zinc metallopeptidase [Sansalvadorimonas sp. 2012CJ34-2]MCL6268347.1 zinc metallopeptidase [Sansalvadorimonas sp. 2012CJ34-2]